MTRRSIFRAAKRRAIDPGELVQAQAFAERMQSPAPLPRGLLDLSMPRLVPLYAESTEPAPFPFISQTARIPSQEGRIPFQEARESPWEIMRRTTPEIIPRSYGEPVGPPPRGLPPARATERLNPEYAASRGPVNYQAHYGTAMMPNGSARRTSDVTFDQVHEGPRTAFVDLPRRDYAAEENAAWNAAVARARAEIGAARGKTLLPRRSPAQYLAALTLGGLPRNRTSRR